jgi:hypothetical protein
MPCHSRLASHLSRTFAAALVFAAGASQSSIVYQFSFSPQGSPALPAFGVTLEFANYVTTTGMQAVTPVFQNSTASIGYGVNYAGTNAFGDWGFDDSADAVITNSGFTFNGSSFVFASANIGYFTAPGTYAGFVQGNSAPQGLFGGIAELTIRDTNGTVPEPASLALVLLALGAAAAAGRRTR